MIGVYSASSPEGVEQKWVEEVRFQGRRTGERTDPTREIRRQRLLQNLPSSGKRDGWLSDTLALALVKEPGENAAPALLGILGF